MSDDDFEELFEVVRATHKYGYEKTGGWALRLLSASMKQERYSPDYNFLPLLDFALASGMTDIQDQVTRIIKKQFSRNSVVLSDLFAYAEGKTHEAWKRLLGWAYYHCTITLSGRGDLAASFSPEHIRIFKAAQVKLIQMSKADIPRDHICDNWTQCNAQMRQTLRSFNQSHEGRADFLSWVQKFMQKRPAYCHNDIDRCFSLAFSLYEIQAGNLVIGLWNFFNELEY